MRHGPATFYSDVFSYGMVLWEFLNHKQPFAELPTAEVYKEVLQGKVEYIHSQWQHTLYKLSSNFSM